MPKSPRSSGPGPKTPSKKLLGSGSKSKDRMKPKGGNVVPPVLTDPSQQGNTDVVAQRNAATVASGKMLHNQLKKNKSSGIKPR